MILKETILSAFTERGTLLKWLKKVEASLNNAVLTDISVEQISETQIKLKFTFENGDYVESPILTLPRGEPGKDGLDGEGIAATIEIGTVTTGAPGTNASVTNVGTEQRAILNFVIPRGEEGGAGVGFDDADGISINDGTLNITAGDNGVNIVASFEVAVGEELLEIPSTMYLPIKGSESVVIDVDESGEFIDIHLDASIVTKLSHALVTPMSAPATVSLVAVDTSNAQTMLTIGNGLSVSGNVLSATGGSGGTQLYRHYVEILDELGGRKFDFVVIDTDPEDFSSDIYLFASRFDNPLVSPPVIMGQDGAEPTVQIFKESFVGTSANLVYEKQYTPLTPTVTQAVLSEGIYDTVTPL